MEAVLDFRPPGGGVSLPDELESDQSIERGRVGGFVPTGRSASGGGEALELTRKTHDSG